MFQLSRTVHTGWPGLDGQCYLRRILIAGASGAIKLKSKKHSRDKPRANKNQRVLKARGSFSEILTVLNEAVEEGSVEGAEALAEIASYAAWSLQIEEQKKPELFRRVARATQLWPVMARHEPGWEKEALQRVSALELGADLQIYEVRFRKARGTDTNLPARRWAKAAVRTIEATRLRLLGFGAVVREFGSHQALADFCMETGWQIGEQPEWMADVVKLPAFSKESLPSWKLAIRKMIREQMPDFHTRPEWNSQRNTAVANGRKPRAK